MAGALRLLITRDMPRLDPDLDAVVERHWTVASSRRPLFNGRVFCADTVLPHEIHGHWTEYRRVVAQIADPALGTKLAISSLAVCGVLFGPDGVVVGRREPGAAYQPGLWQLPPAGSVDKGAAVPGGASWRQALLTELREELGIAAAEVTAMRPLCLVRHPSGILDMGVRIDTDLDAAAILDRHGSLGDREYDRLMVVLPALVAGRVAAQGGTLVPSATPFLARALAAGGGFAD